MKRGSIVFAVAGLIIGGAWFVGASAIRAQQPAQQPAPAPTQAVPPIGPPDPNLRTVPVPEGKKVHLLPATLETTQWGWFNNAQPPVLRINSGDTVVMETMMHSHNQVDQEAQNRFSRPRTAHVDRTDLYRGRRAGRRSQDHNQQDRPARLRGK